MKPILALLMATASATAFAENCDIDSAWPIDSLQMSFGHSGFFWYGDPELRPVGVGLPANTHNPDPLTSGCSVTVLPRPRPQGSSHLAYSSALVHDISPGVRTWRFNLLEAERGSSASAAFWSLEMATPANAQFAWLGAAMTPSRDRVVFTLTSTSPRLRSTNNQYELEFPRLNDKPCADFTISLVPNPENTSLSALVVTMRCPANGLQSQVQIPIGSSHVPKNVRYGDLDFPGEGSMPGFSIFVPWD